jgi:hypothetical protein
MKFLLFTIAGLLAVKYNSLTQEKPPYVLVKTKNNIALYEHWITGASNTNIRELKVEFATTAGHEKIIGILKNASRGKEWNKNAVAFKTILQSDNSWLTYIRYHIPWPFDDQDICMQYHIAPGDKAGREIHFQSVASEHFPVNKNVTRITGAKGKWVLAKTADDKTQVFYTIATEKSAKVPRWVSDPLVHNNLLDAMAALRKIIED